MHPRFVLNAGKWHLHTTVDLPYEFRAGRPRDVGCIAVEVNEKEIAVTETDRSGNYVWSETHAAVVKDLGTEQTKALYSDLCKTIIDRCVRKGKPLGHGKLDFKKKRAALREEGAAYARMLLQFAYAMFLTMLDRRASRQGVAVYTDNPAYTSVIGKVNFMGRCGISPHEAAARVIARRVQRYSERPIKQAELHVRKIVASMEQLE